MAAWVVQVSATWRVTGGRSTGRSQVEISTGNYTNHWRCIAWPSRKRSKGGSFTIGSYAHASTLPGSAHCLLSDHFLLKRCGLEQITGELVIPRNGGSTVKTQFLGVCASSLHVRVDLLGRSRVHLEKVSNDGRHFAIRCRHIQQLALIFQRNMNEPIETSGSLTLHLCPPANLDRPLSDHFALVPRAFSDRVFMAVTAYYACDGSSWPPSAPWWQPGCNGQGFEESVLFRYLHASGVPYRLYPMFENVVARGRMDDACRVEEGTYTMACGLLKLAHLLPVAFSR